MERTLKIIVVIYLTMVCALPVLGKRKSLVGCTFRSYDFHVIELRFYDREHCECTQYCTLPWSFENKIRTDTVLYSVDGYQVRFYGTGDHSDVEIDPRYHALRFYFNGGIKRDGTTLGDYYIRDVSNIVGCNGIRDTWYTWQNDMIGILLYEDVFELNCTLYHLIEGHHHVPYIYRDNKYSVEEWKCSLFYGLSYPCDVLCHIGTRKYFWFTRSRSQLTTAETQQGVSGNRFVYSNEMLYFVDGSSCMYYQSDTLQQIFPYKVESANVLIYGMDQLMPEKADTLVYDDRVLYHSCITQTSNVLQPVDPPTGFIIDYIPEKYAPTAQMETRAYVLEGADVTDEQIGTTFQHIFTPMNFHSFVPSD